MATLAVSQLIQHLPKWTIHSNCPRNSNYHCIDAQAGTQMELRVAYIETASNILLKMDQQLFLHVLMPHRTWMLTQMTLSCFGTSE